MNIRKTFIFSLFSLLIFSASVFAQNDFKMTQRMVMTGRTSETTVMIKGARERTENNSSGMRQATIMQCDLKRTVHINDIEKKYYIEPMATDAPAETPTTTKTVSKGKTTKGGVVTQTIEITDTGERKQMFGLTARRIKTVMTVEPSADACQKEASRVETDGWYVDLSPGMVCKTDRPVDRPSEDKPSGCVDRPNVIKKGSGKLGYALQVTTKFSVPGMGEQDAETKAMMARMGMGDGMMSMTTEVTALTKAPQAAELFDIPAGYKQVSEMGDLFGMETQKAMGKHQNTPQGQAERNQMIQNVGGMQMPGASSAVAKKAGMIRIGVMAVNNSSGKELSTDNYQMMLVGQIRGDKVEAVKINSMEEAKQLECDYILNSDVQPFKQSTASKVGGMFGKVTGTSSGQPKVEATVSYNLTPTTGAGLAVQNNASAKVEGEENSVMMALNEVAKAVMKAVKK